MNMPLAIAGLFGIFALATSWHPFPLGAIFGALLFAFFFTPFAEVGLAPYWLFALGGLFVAVTLLLPKGIVGAAADLWAARRGATAGANGSAADAEPSPRPAE